MRERQKRKSVDKSRNERDEKQIKTREMPIREREKNYLRDSVIASMPVTSKSRYVWLTQQYSSRQRECSIDTQKKNTQKYDTNFVAPHRVWKS